MLRLSLAFACLAAAPAIADDAVVNHYGHRIIAPADLAPVAAAAVDDLRRYLTTITGAEFASTRERGEHGIILARATESDVPPAAFKLLEVLSPQSFCLWPDNSRLWLVAASDAGLSHAASYYLEHLGVRWYAPTERWTIVPLRSDIRVSEPILRSPAFHSRAFYGSGGFGGSLPCDPKRSLQETWMAWQRRNRLGGEFAFAGHTGEAFNTKFRTELEAHPEYLAELDGKRVPWSLTAKWCSSNADVLKLYVEDRLAALRQNRSFDPAGPRSRVVSVEPADGGGHCECETCRKRGSVSDRVFHVANVVARAVRAEFPDSLVSLYAYHAHAAVPSIELEDNVFVLVIPYGFQRTDLSPEQLLTAWGRKTKHLGVYDYWSIPDWSRDRPSFDFLGVGPEKLRFWRSVGVDAFSMETTFSTGAMGPAWWIGARLAWDVEVDEAELFDEFCRDCFGPAAKPMHRLFSRWSAGYYPSSHELALAYRDVAEALALTTDDEACRRRVADVGRYVEYLKLEYAYSTAGRDPERRRAATDTLLAHLWNIYDSTMVHAFRLSQLILRDETPREPNIRDRYDVKNPQAAGWTTIRPLTDDDLERLVAAGVQDFAPQEFVPRRYSGKLQPLETATSATSGEFGPIFWPSSSQLLDVLAPPGMSSFTLRVAIDKPLRLTVMDDANATIASKLHEHRAGGLAEWQDVTVALPRPGLYRLRLHSPKIAFGLQVPLDVQLSMPGWFNSQGRPTPRLYFYVPHETSRLAIYATYTAAGPPKFFDPDGAEVQPTFVDDGRLTLIDVPPSHRGRVWSLDKAKVPVSDFELLNAPMSFAFTPDALLVPSDALPK